MARHSGGEPSCVAGPEPAATRPYASIFKACDIRGIVGQDWDAGVAARLGRSLGAMLRRRDQTTVCVGGDFRRSTPELQRAVIDGLAGAGLAVIDVGQAATPVVYFAGRHLSCPNVVVVTASHNPGPYNGIKFLLAGRPPTPELMGELQAGLDAPPRPIERGPVRRCDITADYTRWVLQHAVTLVPDAVAAGAGLRIVVDGMAGAMTELAPQVLTQAGHHVTTFHERIDPDYASGPPDPSCDAHLLPLAERVIDAGADLGAALDGDGDRIIFVDGDGRIVRPEQIGAVLATRLTWASLSETGARSRRDRTTWASLSETRCPSLRDGTTCPQPGRPTLVYDLKCASVLAQAVEAVGGRALMRPSGHGFIKATMLDERADLGVEVSGHHFYGTLDGGDDGLLTALVIARLSLAEQTPLNRLIAAFPWPAITPDIRIPFTGDTRTLLEAIAAQCGGTVTRLDGIRAQYAGGWALARASITEPAVTLRFEGRDWNHVPEIADRFLAAVPHLRAALPPAALHAPLLPTDSSHE